MNITKEDRQQYREDLDTIVVRESNFRKRGGSTANKSLHIPDENGEPVCETDAKLETRGWTEKSIKCYPPGHKEICERCIIQDSVEHQTKKYDREDCQQALQAADEQVDGTLSERKYNSVKGEDQPSAVTLREYYGSWTDSKEELL